MPFWIKEKTRTKIDNFEASDLFILFVVVNEDVIRFEVCMHYA